MSTDEPRMIACPSPGCSVELPERDMEAQSRHMEQRHPEIIAQRRREAARYDGWED